MTFTPLARHRYINYNIATFLRIFSCLQLLYRLLKIPTLIRIVFLITLCLSLMVGTIIQLTGDTTLTFGVPSWSWHVPLFFGCALYMFYKKAQILGDATQIILLMKLSAASLLLLIPGFFLGDMPKGTGLYGIGRFLTWNALVISPVSSFVIASVVLFELRKKK